MDFVAKFIHEVECSLKCNFNQFDRIIKLTANFCILETVNFTESPKIDTQEKLKKPQYESPMNTNCFSYFALNVVFSIQQSIYEYVNKNMANAVFTNLIDFKILYLLASLTEEMEYKIRKDF